MEELILKYLNNKFPGEITYSPDTTFIRLKVNGMDVGVYHTSKRDFFYHVRLYNDIRNWFEGVPNNIISNAVTKFLSPKFGETIKTREDIQRHIIQKLS